MATVLFVAPHQDDETLSMGASIRKHLEVGHDVHVLLLTYGVNSAVRPATGLDRPQFTRARDDEMFRATRALGVTGRNVHVSRHSCEDGVLTVQGAEDAMRAWLNDHPGAWLKAYSNLSATGRHGDHVTAGQAAVNLLAAGVVPNLRLYVEPWARDAFAAAHPTMPLTAERATSHDRVKAAYTEYQDEDLPGRRYGIGYKSVGPYFDQLRTDPAGPASYYHLP